MSSMSCLICKEGPVSGRTVRLHTDRPRRLQMVHKGQKSGEMVFWFDSGKLFFANKSQIPSYINDINVEKQALQDGDEVRCGPHIFEVRLAADDVELSSITATSDLELFDNELSPMEAAEQASQPPTKSDQTSNNRIETNIYQRTQSGDTKETDEVIDDFDEDRPLRNSRRISAARMSAVDGSGNKQSGILKRVSRVFGRKKNNKDRLEECRAEREQLLALVGRRTLEGQGGFGLPAGFLQQLSRGETRTLSRQDLNQPELERYYNLSERLRFLDTEIIKLRIDVGDDSTEDNSLCKPALQTELDQKREEAFQSMDEIKTEDMLLQLDEQSPSDHISDDLDLLGGHPEETQTNPIDVESLEVVFPDTKQTNPSTDGHSAKDKSGNKPRRRSHRRQR